MKRISLAVIATLTLASTGTMGDEIEAKLQKLVTTKLSSAFSVPVIVTAVEAQNERNATLSQGDIDSLDKQWRSEAKTGSGPLINKVLNNEISAQLRTFKDEGAGLYTEVFIMDNKGLNVGQSDVTSDYWQGDESKWQKTFGAGSSVFIDGVEFDESTQTYQSQVSMTLVDPYSGANIGAVTVGVNVDALQ